MTAHPDISLVVHRNAPPFPEESPDLASRRAEVETRPLSRPRVEPRPVIVSVRIGATAVSRQPDAVLAIDGKSICTGVHRRRRQDVVPDQGCSFRVDQRELCVARRHNPHALLAVHRGAVGAKREWDDNLTAVRKGGDPSVRRIQLVELLPLEVTRPDVPRRRALNGALGNCQRADLDARAEFGWVSAGGTQGGGKQNAIIVGARIGSAAWDDEFTSGGVGVDHAIAVQIAARPNAAVRQSMSAIAQIICDLRHCSLKSRSAIGNPDIPVEVNRGATGAVVLGVINICHRLAHSVPRNYRVVAGNFVACLGIEFRNGSSAVVGNPGIVEIDLPAVEHDAAVRPQGDAVPVTAAPSVQGDAAAAAAVDEDPGVRREIAWPTIRRTTVPRIHLVKSRIGFVAGRAVQPAGNQRSKQYEKERSAHRLDL